MAKKWWSPKVCKTKVLAGPCSFGRCYGRICPVFLSYCLVVSGISWLTDTSLQAWLHYQMATSYYLPLCMSVPVSKFPLYVTPVLLGFPGGSDSKESACNAGDLGLIPVLGRSPGEAHGYPLQYSCLENSMDRGYWAYPNDLIFLGYFYKDLFPNKITVWDLGVRTSTYLLGVHNSLHWRRKWQLTPVFLPGKTYGQRNLGGYSPWGHKESNTN